MSAAPERSGLILPGRPAFPFLVQSDAAAKPLPAAPGQPSVIAYSVTFMFIDSVAVQGKGLVLEWRQGVTARALAAALQKAVDQLEAYAAEVTARDQAANQAEPKADSAEPGKNGTERPLPAPGDSP